MKIRALYLGSAAVLLAASLAFPVSSSAAEHPSLSVPKGVAFATDKGRVNPGKELSLTVVLNLHNKADYDKAVEALYDPQSPTFHKWFTDEDFLKYAPTEEEFASVRNELIKHGFTVVSSDPHRYSIRVHGTVAHAETAFQTEIHSFSLQGRTFEAHTNDARLTGPAGDLVSAVAGLERHQATSMLTVAKNIRTGQPRFKKPLATVKANGGILSQITQLPLSAPETFNYTTSGAALPTSTYTGTVYDENPSLIPSYTPTDLQTHYGLAPLIEEGWDGTGQTIALVEGYGYAAAESDANTFSQLFGLPALTSKNFEVIYPEGKPLNPNAADLTGWTTEIALDIETAHSIAPGAKIIVVASAGQDNEDQIASLEYVINHKLAHTVSNSWENDDEIIAGPAELNAFNSVLQKGAAAGISIQFSSGDGGDLGLGTPVGAVAVPSDAPYAVAVGGTSVLNNPVGLGEIVTGWGNNATYVALGGALDPPFVLGFLGGAGGGQSQYFAKPSWQTGVPGKWRQVPDVSALADPNTGVVVIVTEEGTQFVLAGVGGTSLASPLFSAIWAIGDQINGKPLGFATPTIAQLKPGQITDVLPTNAIVADDPAGSVTDSSGTTDYSAADLFSGLLYTQTQFTSGLLPFDSADAAVVSFGTDSSLTVTKGWDNVTGYGEPNGLPFYFAILDNEAAKNAVKKVQVKTKMHDIE
jgi:subtilase family serine protease